MIPADFVGFFAAVVGVTGALIGLLFVAVSFAPRRLHEVSTADLAQTQASAALLVFLNTLVLGLVALMPGQHIGWGTVIVAALGVIYSMSVGRIALARRTFDRAAARALATIAFGALMITAFEGWAGIEILRDPFSARGISTLAWTMTAGVVFGISRAWELVGLHGTSLFRSLAVLRDPAATDPVTAPELEHQDACATTQTSANLPADRSSISHEVAAGGARH